MRHDYEGPGPRVQQILQCSEHLGVDVVGRLIEDEDVGLTEQDQQQLEPTFLSTRELTDSGLEVSGLEAESFQ